MQKTGNTRTANYACRAGKIPFRRIRQNNNNILAFHFLPLADFDCRRQSRSGRNADGQPFAAGCRLGYISSFFIFNVDNFVNQFRVIKFRHKTGADARKEDDILLNWVSTLPEDAREEWTALLTEMNAMETREAKIYKALDKMEAVIQHNESDISTWLPLEYDLQLTYGEENVEFSPYMRQLKAEVNDRTREKIAWEKPE